MDVMSACKARPEISAMITIEEIPAERIGEFWVFPEYRGNGTGHRCFDALERYTREDGANYYEINSSKDSSVRFWRSLGFIDNGRDEWDMPLMIKR